MKIFNVISIPLALGLMLVSIYFSIGLLSHFAVTETEYYIYSFAAMLFQLSMNVLWVIGHYYKKSNPIQSIFAFTGWGILLTISLVGTIGAFSVSTSKTEAIQASERKRFIAKQIDDINDSIEYYQKEMRYGVRNRLITTTVKPCQEELKNLNEKKSDLLSELERVTENPPADQFFGSLAKFIGSKINTVKMWLFFLVAIAVDLTQFVLLKYALDAGLLGGKPKDKVKI